MIRVNLLKTDPKSAERKSAAVEAEAKADRKKTAAVPKGNLIVFAVIVILGALVFLQKQSMNREKALLEAAQNEQRILAPVTQKLTEYEQQKLFLEMKITLIEALRLRQSVPLSVLDSLSRGLPDWVWLVEANYRNQILEIKGRALSHLQVSDYMDNLQSSGLFRDVSLLSSTQRSVGSDVFLEFTLNAAVIIPEAPKAGSGPEAR